MIISGMGMVSSLGLDALTACAAARAGLDRISCLKHYQVWNPAENKLEPAKGHGVPDLAEGFTGLGRLVRLSVAGIRDLLTRSPIDNWDRTGLFIGLSDRSILMRHAELVSDENKESTYAEVLKFKQICETRFIDMVRKSSEGIINPILAKLFWGDSTATLLGVSEAMRHFESGALHRCIVGGVDSLLDVNCLEALNAFSLLKTPTNPFGILPGEGASFVLLEPQTAVLSRKGIEQTTLKSTALSTEAFNRFSSNPPVGVALSASIRQTLEGRDGSEKCVGLILVD